MAECLDAGRYRLLAKLQLTEPGKGRHPGLLRNYLADANCDAAQIQVYARFVLLDCVTGYRSQYQDYATILQMN